MLNLTRFGLAIPGMISQQQIVFIVNQVCQQILPEEYDIDEETCSEWGDAISKALSHASALQTGVVAEWNPIPVLTPSAIAAFLGQTIYESQGYSSLEENLSYSWTRLREVFPKYFRTDRAAIEAEKDEQRIANVVYAHRMGNGGVMSGDGYLYRGRGPIQITGRTNYKRFNQLLSLIGDGRDILSHPELISEDKYLGALSAVWFFNDNDIWPAAISFNINSITKSINGGYNGLYDRIALCKKCLVIINESIVSFPED